MSDQLRSFNGWTSFYGSTHSAASTGIPTITADGFIGVGPLSNDVPQHLGYFFPWDSSGDTARYGLVTDSRVLPVPRLDHSQVPAINTPQDTGLLYFRHDLDSVTLGQDTTLPSYLPTPSPTQGELHVAAALRSVALRKRRDADLGTSPSPASPSGLSSTSSGSQSLLSNSGKVDAEERLAQMTATLINERPHWSGPLDTGHSGIISSTYTSQALASPSSSLIQIPHNSQATSVVREEAPLYHALSSQDVDTLDCIHTLCYTLSGGREPLQTPAQEGGDPAAVANAVTHLARQAESIRKTIEGPRNESMAEKLASVSINMTSQLDLPVSLRVSTQRKLLMELPGLESTKARALANTGRFGTAYDGIQLAKEVAFGYENERQTAVEHTERKHDRGEDAWDGTGHRNEANQGNEGKCGDTEVDQDYTNKTARGETLSHEGHDDHIRECSAKVLQSLPSLLELPREDANSCANHSTRCESATSSTLPASPGSSLAPPCSSDPQLQLGQSSAALSAVPYTSDVNSTRSMTRSRTSIADDKVVPDSVMDWSSSDDDDSVLSAGGRLPLLLSRLAQSNGSALDQHRLSQLYEDQWLPPHRHPSVASEVMRTRIRRSGSVKQKGGEKPPLWTARTQAMHEVDAKQKALKQVYDEKIKTITREYKRETGRLLIINPTNEEETKKRDESLSIARTAYLRKRAELTVATAQDFVTSALEQGKLYGVDLRRKIAKLWLVKKGNECACALNLPNVLVIPKEAEVMKRKVRGSRPLSKDKKDVMQDAGAPVREDRTDYSDDNAIADNRIDEDDVSSGDSENEDNAWAWDREAVDRGWVEAFYKEISPQPSKCDGVQVPLEVLSEAVREDTSHRSIRRQLNPDLDACAMAVGPLGETLQQRISLEIVREHVWSEAAAIAISKSHTHGKKMKMSHQDYIGAYSSSHLAFLPTGPGMRSLSSALIVTPPSQHTLHALSLRHQDSSSTSSEHMSPRFSPIARILTTARTAPFPKSIVQIATCTSGLHASNLTEKLLTAVNRIQSREKEGIMRQRNAIRSIHQRTSSIQSTTRSSNGIDGAMASGSIATGVPPLKRKRSETDPLDVGAKRGHLRQKRAALSSLEPRGNKRKSDTMGGWSNHIQTTGLEDIDDISRFESLEGEGELSAVDVEDIASDVEIGSANTVGRSINGSGDGHGDDGDDDDSGDARQNRQRITSQGSTSEMSGENSEWATNVGGRREIGDSYAMKLAYELGTLGSVTLGDQGQHLVMARTTRHVALFKSQLVDGWSSDSDDGDDEPRRDHGGVDHYAFASPKREIGGYLLGELPGGKERVRHLKSAYVKGRRARKGKGHKSQLNNEHDQERQRKRRSKVGLSLLSSSDSDSTQSSDREIGSEEEEDSTEKAIRRLEDKDPDWFRPKLKRIAAVETPVPMIHAEPHPLFAEEVLLLCVDGRMLVWDVEASVSSLSSSSSLLVNDNPVTGVSMGKWSRSNDHREAWEDHQTSIPPYPQRKRSRPTSTETTKKHGTQRNQGARPRDTTKNSDERVDGDGGSSGNESDDNDYGSRKRRRRKVVPDRDFIASHPNVHVSVEVADAWEVLEDEERQKEGRASLTQQLARGGAVEMQTGYAPFSKRNPLLGESNRPWWQIGNESEKDAQEWRLSKYLSTDQGTLVKLAYEEDDDASLALVQDSLGMELHKCGSQSQRQAFLNALSGGSYSSQFTPQFWSHGTHADGVLTLSNWWRAPTFSGNVHDMNELYSTRQSPSSQGGDGKTTRTPWKDIPNDGYGGALTGVLAGGIYPGQPTNITDPKYWARRERTMQMTKAMVIHALDERHPSFVDPSLAYQSAQTPFPPWGTVKYSMHPRVALVATPSRIYAVDLRAANAIPVQSTLAGVAPFIPTPSAPGTFSQCHTRSSGSYHSTSSSSTALLSRGVSVLPLPLMLDGIDQRIYGIQTDPSCPSHLAVSTSSQLLLLDQRSPCAPLLRWDMPSARATTHDLVKRRTNISYIREGDTSTSSSVLAAQIGHWYSRSTAPIRAPLIIHAYKEGHFCPTIGVNTLRTVPLRDISFLHCPSIDPLVAPIAVELLTASTRTHPTQQNLQPKGGKRGPSQPHRIYITTPSTDTPRHNPISGGETTTSSPQQLVMPHTYIPLLHPTSALSSRSFIVASSSRYGVTLLFEYVQLSPADAAQVALSDASVDRLKKGGRSFGSKEGLSALFASPRENEDYLLGQTPLGTAYTACGPPHVLGVFDKSFDETMLPVGIKGTTGNMTTNNAADQLHPVLIEGDGTARHLAATHAKDPERVLPDPSKPLELDNVWENQHLLDETRETYTFPVRELFPATFIATTLVHHHPKFVVALPGSYVNPPRTVDSDPLTLSSKVLSRRPTLGELIELLPSDAASARRFTIERLTYCGELSLHPFAMCMLDPTQTMSPPLTTTTSTTGAPSSNGLPSSPTNTVELNPPTSTSSSPPSSTTTLSASFPSPTTPGLLDLPFWSGKMPTDKDIALPIGARISAGLAPVPYVPPFVSPGLTQAMSSILVTNRLQDPLNLVPPLISTATSVKVAQSHSLLLLPSSRCAVENVNTLVDVIARFEHDLANFLTSTRLLSEVLYYLLHLVSKSIDIDLSRPVKTFSTSSPCVDAQSEVYRDTSNDTTLNWLNDEGNESMPRNSSRGNSMNVCGPYAAEEKTIQDKLHCYKSLGQLFAEALTAYARNEANKGTSSLTSSSSSTSSSLLPSSSLQRPFPLKSRLLNLQGILSSPLTPTVAPSSTLPSQSVPTSNVSLPRICSCDIASLSPGLTHHLFVPMPCTSEACLLLYSTLVYLHEPEDMFPLPGRPPLPTEDQPSLTQGQGIGKQSQSHDLTQDLDFLMRMAEEEENSEEVEEREWNRSSQQGKPSEKTTSDSGVPSGVGSRRATDANSDVGQETTLEADFEECETEEDRLKVLTTLAYFRRPEYDGEDGMVLGEDDVDHLIADMTELAMDAVDECMTRMGQLDNRRDK